MAKRRRIKELHSAQMVPFDGASSAGARGGGGLPPEERPIKPLPAPVERGPDTPLVSSVENQRSYFTNAAYMVASSSLAYQLDPQFQMMMRRDPDIEASGQALWLAVACSEWSIEADDDEDAAQVECAAWLTDVFRQVPNLTDMLRQLMLAEWYGTSGVNFVVTRDPVLDFRVRKWVPLHGDTIAFDQWGNAGMRVGAAYLNDGLSVVDMGFNSWVHIFDAQERASVIVHSVFREAPYFDDYRSADQMFRGTGNRDRVWFYWYLKQEIMQQAAIWCKRYSAGIRVGRYPNGNQQAQQEILQALSNLINDNNVALPRVPGESPDSTDISIMDPPAAKAAMFMDLINWLSGKVKEVRQGQSLTSEAHGTGLGSGVAYLHENTKSLILKYHANALAESVTQQMLWSLASLRGYSPEVFHAVRLKIATERPNIKERLEAAKVFVDMGGELSMDEVRETTGFAKPAPGEAVLSRSMGGGQMLDDLLAIPERAGAGAAA